MRSEHPIRRADIGLPGDQGQRIGVHHHRLARCQCRIQQASAPRIQSQPGANGNHRGRLHQRSCVFRAIHPAHHDFRLADQRHRHMGRTRNQRHFARPATGGGLGTHDRRAGKTMIATNHQHMAIMALVAIHPAGGQTALERLGAGAKAVRLHLGVDIPPHLQIEKTQRAAMQRPFAGEQTALETNKGTGHLRLQHCPQRHAAVGAEPRRNIQRQHRKRQPIQGAQQGGHVITQRTFKTSTQQAINQQVRRARQVRVGERLHGNAGCLATSGHGQGIALELIRRAGKPDLRLQAGLRRQPRHHIAITTVITATTQHRQLAGLRPALAEGIKGRLPGPLHQIGARGAGGNGQSVQLAGLRRGV